MSVQDHIAVSRKTYTTCEGMQTKIDTLDGTPYMAAHFELRRVLGIARGIQGRYDLDLLCSPPDVLSVIEGAAAHSDKVAAVFYALKSSGFANDEAHAHIETIFGLRS